MTMRIHFRGIEWKLLEKDIRVHLWHRFECQKYRDANPIVKALRCLQLLLPKREVHGRMLIATRLSLMT